MKSITLALFLILFYHNNSIAQDFYDNKLIAADSLMEILNKDPESIYLLNTGPVQNIKYAVKIGAVENKSALDKLAAMLPTLKNEKTVVIYCGCCPLVVCPNLEPAVNLLEQNAFNVFILNLPEGIQEDWIDKGYPLDAKK